MSLDIILVSAILAVTVLVLVMNWLRADLVALGVVIVLAVTGLLSPREALAGFSSDAVIVTAALLVLGAGLVRTGVVKWIADRLHHLSARSETRLLMLNTAVPGVLSGFISIVATASVFIPAVLRLGRGSDVPVSRLLMPMAFTTMAGANLTLFGASHNLVANSLVQEAGERGFGVFEFAPVGLALIGVAIGYGWLFHRRLLPDHKRHESKAQHPTRALMKRYAVEDRLWEVWVGADSSVIGKRLGDLDIDKRYGLSLLSVVRSDEPHIVHHGNFVLRAHDVLLVGGKRARAAELCRDHEHLRLVGEPKHHEEFPAHTAELIELAVSPHSSVIGKTLRALKFRNKTGLTGLGLWRAGRALRTDVAKTRLRAGDAVLFFGARDNTRHFDAEPDWLWVKRPKQEEAPRELRPLRLPAAVLALTVVTVAALDWVPLVIAALAGAVGMILLGAVNTQQAYDSVEWRTVVLIGGLLPLGTALQQTGAAELLADALVNLTQGWGPRAALLAVSLCALLLTQPLHNAAVMVIMVPVALHAAGALDANPHAFAVAVIAAASATYLMPAGHPAGMLIQQPGRYRPRDFPRYGAGLALTVLIVIAFLVPWLWPLQKS